MIKPGAIGDYSGIICKVVLRGEEIRGVEAGLAAIVKAW